MLELGITEKTFKLGCAPIVNLFAQTCGADSARSDGNMNTRSCPMCGGRTRLEVFSVDEVVSIEPRKPGHRSYYEPFYSSHHGRAAQKGPDVLACDRRPSHRQHDSGTEDYISLLDCLRPGVAPGHRHADRALHSARIATCRRDSHLETKRAISTWKPVRRSNGSSR